MTLTIKLLIFFIGVLSLSFSPAFVSAKIEPINIASPVEGFIQGQQEQALLISGLIRKNLWEDKISKQGGVITIYATAADKQVSESLDNVTPIVNKRGKITAYSYNLSLHTEALRGAEDLPIKIWVEAKNKKGRVIASDEVRGTIKQIHSPTLIVALAPNTPPPSVLAQGTTNASFVSLMFTAGTQENIMINQLTLTRNGGTDDDLLNIRVFNGATQIGSAVARFIGGKTTLSGLTWVIPKDSTKTFSVKTDVDLAANTYSLENGISVGVGVSSDIQAIGTESANIVNLVNFVPVFGNSMGITLAE